MRLRLRILRNELPPVNTLWPVADWKLQTTIAQLLSSVNAIFPLEAEQWGLEDYTVSIGGYECLHYHVLEDVCRADDEVVIKPLQYAEVRARTLLGRDQITSDGKHLMDGLPFGRPLLRGAVRPDLRIPPRRRQRLELEQVQDGEDDEEEDFDEDENENDNEQAMVLFNGEEDDDSEEDDGDFEFEDEDDESEDEKEDTEGDAEIDTDNESVSSASTSEISSVVSSSNSSSDSSDDSDSSDSDSSDSDDASSGGSFHGFPDPSATELISGPRGKPKQQSSRKRKREVGDISEGSCEPPAKKQGIPFEGKEKTKERNRRRREARELKFRKLDDQLPHDADFPALRSWKLAQAKTSVDILEDANSVPIITNIKTTPLTITGPAIDPVVTRKESEKKAELEKKRQELLAAIFSGGVDLTTSESKDPPNGQAVNGAKQDSHDSDEGPEELGVKDQTYIPATDGAGDVKAPTTKVTDMVPSSVARRAKLDLAGSKRLLFGSLGVRVPKTQAEKDALQQKLAAKPKPNGVKASEKIVEPEPEEETFEPDAWKTRIALSAVECIEEGITLSTPPFPFYQRWDPQQRKKKKAGGKHSARYIESKPKRRKTGDYFEEVYDKYNQDGTGDALDYDDVEEGFDDGYWEEGALMEDDYDEEDYDDFPTLPEDITTLPLLAETEAKEDDLVVYQQLACSSATNWEPKMVTLTAQLKTKNDLAWNVLLASRDLPSREYDSEGNRVYSKFEMYAGDEDEADEEDSRERTVDWGSMIEPRLLHREA